MVSRVSLFPNATDVQSSHGGYRRGATHKRIRFGTLAAQAPIHHPFHMATQSATCDILTQGRLDLCLGGRWGSRFGRFFGHGDISSEESRERVAEAIALIKLAWTQERVHFQGKYWQADNLPYYPNPCSSPIHRCCSRPIATIPSPMQRARDLAQCAPH